MWGGADLAEAALGPMRAGIGSGSAGDRLAIGFGPPMRHARPARHTCGVFALFAAHEGLTRPDVCSGAANAESFQAPSLQQQPPLAIPALHATLGSVEQMRARGRAGWPHGAEARLRDVRGMPEERQRAAGAQWGVRRRATKKGAEAPF